MRKLRQSIAAATVAILLCAQLFAAVSSQTPNSVSVSAPAVEWQEKFGEGDSTSQIIQTSDGGYAFIQLSWNHQGYTAPAVLYKINASGSLQWQKIIDIITLTPSSYIMNYFYPVGVVQTGNGGYAMFGAWDAHNYKYMPALVKTDLKGDIVLYENISQTVGAKAFVRTDDGGFLLLGGALVKTNSQGRILWNNTYGHGNYSIIESLIKTNDGGCALTGSTSFNGTNETPNLYYLLTKFDSNGNLEWSRQYGNGPETVNKNITENSGALDGLNRRTTGDNEAVAVTQTADGGFVVAGEIYLERHSPEYVSKSFLVKTDSKGNMEWNKTFDDGYVKSIIQTTDDGLAFVGLKARMGWLVKLDSNGTMQWETTYKVAELGVSTFTLTSIIETSDGALALLGSAFRGSFWDQEFYLTKTVPFLPPPSGKPKEPQPFPAEFVAPIVASIVVAATAVGLLLYLKKQKR